jgi:Na+/H+ antiporter NhaC
MGWKLGRRKFMGNPLKQMAAPVPLRNKAYLAALALTVVVFVIGYFSPKEDLGVWTILPVAYIVVFIIMTQGRMIEGFVFASTLAFIMGSKLEFFNGFVDSFYVVMASDDMIWMIGMIMGMGAILVLMERSGISHAFASWLASKAKSSRSALLSTMLLGIIVFLDDYLNCILVGSSMRPVTDRYKVAREELAYVVDSTAAPVTILVPVSTWFAFSATVIGESEGVGDGMAFMLKTIPFNFYGWTALIIVFLFCMRLMPPLGAMKKAMRRVKETGQLAPDDSTDLTEGAIDVSGVRGWNFVAVLAILIGATVYSGIDLMVGSFITIIVMFFLFIVQRLMTIREYFDTAIEGFKSMVPVTVLLVFIFVFLESIQRLGFQDWVIGAAEPYLRDIPWLMPLICFVLFSLTEFATGSTWGLYALAMPIVYPLAIAVGANPVLAVSAVFSAGCVGAHMCFYSDNTVLSGSASGCNIFRHAVTQLPYCMIGWIISALLYGIMGYTLT